MPMMTTPTVIPNVTMADVKNGDVFRTATGWSTATADAVADGPGRVAIRHKPAGGFERTTPFPAARQTTIRK
jgi:hypothetical protein